MYDNLIVVCYLGGSRGDAISYIIELSTDVYARNSKSQAYPNEHGAMTVATRYGKETLDDDIAGKESWSTESYQDLKNIQWTFADELPGTVAEDWQACVPELWFDIPKQMKVKDALTNSRIVVADHANPRHIRQLLPGAKTIAVVGDIDVIFEIFKVKHLLVKPAAWYKDQPGFELPTNLDRYIAGNRDLEQFPVTEHERARK